MSVWTAGMKDSNVLLNIKIDSKFLMLRSKMNQSLRVEGKKEYPKQSVRQLKVGKLLFLILVFVSHFGSNFIKQLGAFSLIILSIKLIFLYHLIDLSGSNPNSWQTLSWEVPCMTPAAANPGLYSTDSSFS